MKARVLVPVVAAVFAVAFSVDALADNPAAVVDTLNVTVDEICTLTRTAGSGSYTTTLAPNKTNMSLGTSEFTAVCNAPNGYQVTAVFTALVGSVSGTIPYAASKPTTSTYCK